MCQHDLGLFFGSPPSLLAPTPRRFKPHFPLAGRNPNLPPQPVPPTAATAQIPLHSPRHNPKTCFMGDRIYALKNRFYERFHRNDHCFAQGHLEPAPWQRGGEESRGLGTCGERACVCVVFRMAVIAHALEKVQVCVRRKVWLDLANRHPLYGGFAVISLTYRRRHQLLLCTDLG